MRILSGWGATFPERSRSQTVEGVRNPEGGSRPAARGGGRSSVSPSGLAAGSVPGVRKQGETYESESSREAVQNAVPEALPATEGRRIRGLEADRRRVEEDAKSMRGAPLSWSHTTEASISCSPEGQPATVKVERGAANPIAAGEMFRWKPRREAWREVHPWRTGESSWMLLSTREGRETPER
jgi:hypothetical protein